MTWNLITPTPCRTIDIDVSLPDRVRRLSNLDMADMLVRAWVRRERWKLEIARIDAEIAEAADESAMRARLGMAFAVASPELIRQSETRKAAIQAEIAADETLAEALVAEWRQRHLSPPCLRVTP